MLGGSYQRAKLKPLQEFGTQTQPNHKPSILARPKHSRDQTFCRFSDVPQGLDERCPSRCVPSHQNPSPQGTSRQLERHFRFGNYALERLGPVYQGDRDVRVNSKPARAIGQRSGQGTNYQICFNASRENHMTLWKAPNGSGCKFTRRREVSSVRLSV